MGSGSLQKSFKISVKPDIDELTFTDEDMDAQRDFLNVTQGHSVWNGSPVIIPFTHFCFTTVLL